MPEWDDEQEYHTGSYAQIAGFLFVSEIDNNVGNDPQIDGVSWALVSHPLRTTEDLIASTVDLPEGTVIALPGYSSPGDGGAGQWKADSTTGLTASQSPADRVAAELVSGSGRLWSIVHDGKLSVLSLGAEGVDFSSDDSPAIQAALGWAVQEKSATIYFPSGKYRLDSPVTANIAAEFDILFKGDGPDQTRILINNTTGGIDVVTTQRTSNVSAVGLAFVVSGNSTGYGFKFTGVEGGNQRERRGIYRDLFIGPEDMFVSGSIDFPMETSGIYRPYYLNVIVNVEPSLSGTGVGININGSYKAHIDTCYVNGGFGVGISDEATGGEGGYCVATTVNGSAVGYRRTRVNLEPEFWIDNSHFNCNQIGVYIEQCKYVWLTNNLMYCQESASGVGYKDFYIASGFQYNIIGNVYRQPYDATRTHVHLQTAGNLQGVSIRDEKLSATAEKYVFANSLVSQLEIEESDKISTESFVSYPSGFDKYDIRTDDFILKRGLDVITSGPSSASGPNFGYYRDSGSPSGGDSLAELRSYGRNSNDDWVIYAQRKAIIDDPTSGGEMGGEVMFTRSSGSPQREYIIGRGFAVGSTASTKGNGTVNAQESYYLNGNVYWTSGNGSPEGVVSAPVGSLYSRTDGGAGTSLYVKESGAGNTGWVGK